MIRMFGHLSQSGVLLAAVLCIEVVAACDASTPKTSTPPTMMPVVKVPQDAKSISAAIERVEPGGLVLVGPGTYREAVLIDKAQQ